VSTNLTDRFLSQISTDLVAQFRRVDRLWHDLRHSTLDESQIPQTIVLSQESSENLERNNDFDVVICGGTLGILLASVLQKQGWQTAVIERGILRGREQEWNISRQELQVFLDLELLTETELESSIASEYNPARVSFLGGEDIWVNDVLNIGIDPIFLLETLKNKFLAWGGKLFENTPFKGAIINSDSVSIELDRTTITSRLLIDAMGHFSPIAKQARKGEKPEGVCVVVGSCAQGYTDNSTADLIASFTPIRHQCQYFWEAFPARDGRTTYMFSYLDARPERPSLEFFMEEYLKLLPEYQNTELDKLEFKRFLFGFFPSYRQAPLHLPWDRILTVGDSSGSQSPVSFGGFGSMVRHLERLSRGIEEALKTNSLRQKDLALLQPYQPNISVTWLFQRTMSVGVDKQIDPDRINKLMNGVFQVMEKMGDDVLKPFLQDVIQFPALAKTLFRTNPLLALPALPQVGLPTLIDWVGHYLNLGLYNGLYPLGTAIEPIARQLSPRQQYYFHRWLDAWQYGSGRDYRQTKVN
jgi:lycopene cyclase CruP